MSAMLAAAASDLRLSVPAWGSILIIGTGAVYLVLGTRWPRLFNVLSMTVLGCVVGMVASSWIPLSQPLVVILGGLVLGGLAALFRNVTHAVLAGVVLAAVFATLAALAMGEQGWATYFVLNPSDTSFSIRIHGPNLGRDGILAAGLTGLLAGATLAVASLRISRRVVTSAQGAAMVLIGLVELVSVWRGEGRPALAAEFPLTLVACWFCITAIGLLIQRTLDQASAPDADADPDADMVDEEV